MVGEGRRSFMLVCLNEALQHHSSLCRLAQCMGQIFGASRSEPHTSALIDFRFACLLVGTGWLVACAVLASFPGRTYGHLTENEVARRLRTLLAFD